jgi:hypothetical protein
MPILPETEEISNRRNSSLNSRPQIYDGSVRRFFVARRKNCADKSAHYHHSKRSSGSDWQIDSTGKTVTESPTADRRNAQIVTPGEIQTAGT